MQTFLPYADFEKTARVLDYRRLGKQRVETFQLLNALDGKTKGWATHPAALMWRGYEASLALYGTVICKEWKRRGYRDTMHERLADLYLYHRDNSENGYTEDPPWLGNTDFHLSHQSNLVRKLPEFYAPLFPGVPVDLPYIWPLAAPRGEKSLQPTTKWRLHVDYDY